MSVCSMIAFLVHGVCFTCLCRDTQTPPTPIHIAWLTISLYSYSWMYLRHFSVFSISVIFSLFDWVALFG